MKNWTPFREMVEISKADVVIANLWRESIGTVVGIVQARRKGKPVILIDPNYLDSSVLKTILGEECIVHSVERAVNKLQGEIAPQIARNVEVRKRNGVIEPFQLAKLHSSLNALCAKARMEDAVLPDLVAREVHTAVIGAARNGPVESEHIKRFVLEQLSKRTDSLYEDDLKSLAIRLNDTWEEHQRLKDDRRALEDLAREEKQSQEKLKSRNAELESENEKLRRELKDCRKNLAIAMDSDSSKYKNVLHAVQTAKARLDRGLVVHDRALESAADSPYRHPQKVYYALELLAEYAEARRRPENTRLPLDGWLKEQNCPFQFAPNESESTRNDGETEKQRTLQYAGLPLVLRKHLKIGKVGDANDCCRIYFEIMDSEAGKVLIGHVGRHLKTAQE